MGLLGAHVSISGGVHKAPKRGKDLGCESIQIFTKNQMQWKAKPITDEDAERFKDEVLKHGILAVVAHDSYLINLAAVKEDLLKKSRDAFYDEIIRADKLDIPYLVFHPGAHMGAGEKQGLKLVAESINENLARAEGTRVKLLLETTAGQGTNLGYKFEHLAEIIDMVDDKKRMGICFDTAHVFEAGYDITMRETFLEVIDEIDSIIGLDQLKVFHMNDSKTPLGSRVDRHANIGKGVMGLTVFRVIVNEPRFKNTPMVLETPGGEKMYREDLKVLRALIESTDDAYI